MTLLQDLQAAGLPAIDAVPGVSPHFSRALTAPEKILLNGMMAPSEGRKAAGAVAAAAIPNWATWTQAEFDTWCTANLMTDAAIDGSTLSAALKTNIKANNAFVRNSGKMLIALRDYTKIMNGS